MKRTIYFNWTQGLDSAPELVKRCHAHWQELNPEFNFVTLSQDNIHQYIDLTGLPIEALRGTSEQVFSNAVRLTLLRCHGGAWVDATTWPRYPLRDWRISEEFFAFSASGSNGRPLSNWFIYSQQDNYTLARWEKNYIDIFRRHGSLRLLPKQIMRDLWSFLGDFSVFLGDEWLSRTKTYPYYLCHNVFAELLKVDERVRMEWRKTLENPVCQSVVRSGRSTNWFAPTSKLYASSLHQYNPPVIKLDWRIPLNRLPQDSLISDVLSGRLD